MRSVLPVLTAFLCASLAAQPTNRDGVNNALQAMWYAMPGAEFNAAGRAGVAMAGLSTSALVNPAGLGDTAFRAVAELSYRLPAEYWIADLSLTQVTYFPSFVALTVPLGPVRIQAGYARPYDEFMRSGEIPVTTVENPDGTGQFLRLEAWSVVHTAFASLSMGDLNGLSAGVMVGADWLDRHSGFGSTWEQFKGTRMRFVGGIRFAASDRAAFGLAMRGATTAKLDYTTSFMFPPGVRIPVYQYEARSPLEVEPGVGIRLTPVVTLLGSLRWEGWSSVVDGATDRTQVQVGAGVNVPPDLKISVGYFTQFTPTGLDVDYYDQRFLTAGFTWRLSDPLQVSIACISSKPFARSDINTLFGRKDSFSRTELMLGADVLW